MSMPTCPSCIYAQGICEKTGVKIRYSTGCTYYNIKPMTNADRIRAMSDEELAEWLWMYCNGSAKPWEVCTEKYKSCYECWIEWLKQEGDT